MAGELAAEWIKIPDGNGNLQKVWVRDSTARRDIAQLQTDVSGKADAATTLAGYGITDAYTKTQVDGMIPSVPSAYTSNPEMDGTASPGSSAAWARGDHVHPHDSTKADASAIPTKTSDLTNDSGYIDSSIFATVTGTTNSTTSGESSKYNYPAGFTQTNCVVISMMVEYNGNWLYVGDGVMQTSGTLYAKLYTDGITVRNTSQYGISKDFKLLLMKIS